MFGSKLSSADYSGGSIFSLCCGFVGKRRKNSDDDVKAKGVGENDEEEEAEDPPMKSDEDSDKGSKIVKNGDVDIEQVELNVNGSLRSLADDKDGVSDSDKKDNISENGDVETKAIENLLSVGIAKITKKDEEPVTVIDSSDISKSDKEKVGDVEETIIKEDEPMQKNGDLKTKVDEIKSDDDEGKGTDDELIRKEKKVKDKSKKKGAAYQYEDASSSDSDDEVLKHYKENLVRSASMRSAKSGRTKATDAGVKHSSRGSVHDPELLMEQGEISSKLSYNAETDDGRHASPHVETPNSDSPSRGGSRTFENRAFTGDGPQSMSAESDQAQSTDQLNSDEHLFDVSDLQNEPPLISKCGSLEVSFRYDNANSRMVVVILQAREIPSKDRGGANSTQVRVMLLPNKKQRHKSKVKMGDNPVFGEKIYFNKILPDEIPNMGLRFRLYGLERMRRERMIGESIVGFASLNLDQETTHWVVLEPRSNLTQGDSGFDVSSLSRSDSASSTQSLQHGGMPELLLGLSYNGTTGRLSVEAIKGSNFRNMAMNRAPDTYVKISLMNSSGQEVQHCKTSVRRGQPNPLFKETFMLQVALFQLPDVTLMVSVYNKKSMKKKEMIGWFSLGMNSSGEEEASHWGDMRESKGEQVCRWHVLLES